MIFCEMRNWMPRAGLALNSDMPRLIISAKPRQTHTQTHTVKKLLRTSVGIERLFCADHLCRLGAPQVIVVLAQRGDFGGRFAIAVERNHICAAADEQLDELW